MATWNSRGLRGSILEELVNYTNEKYLDQGLALIQKIPTPITPVKFDKETRHITLAYFEKRSTVDYIGAVQGIPVCFDAKESAEDRFPMQNIHAHQVAFMDQFERQGGVSFLLLYFTERQICYYLRFREMMTFWKRMEAGGPKHFKFQELDQRFYVPSAGGVTLHYLKTLERDLEERRKEEDMSGNQDRKDQISPH